MDDLCKVASDGKHTLVTRLVRSNDGDLNDRLYCANCGQLVPIKEKEMDNETQVPDQGDDSAAEEQPRDLTSDGLPEGSVDAGAKEPAEKLADDEAEREERAEVQEDNEAAEEVNEENEAAEEVNEENNGN